MKCKVGDTIVILTYDMALTIGKEYVVIEENVGPRVIDDCGDPWWLIHTKYEVVPQDFKGLIRQKIMNGTLVKG